MNRWNLIGYLAGVLMLLSSLAHAFAGWPAMTEALKGTSTPPEIEGALRVGWLWGSFCLAGFGLVMLAQARRSTLGLGCDTGSVAAVALSFVSFGIWALLDRHFNPHFLLFVALGLLSASLLHPAARRPGQTP